MLLNALQISRNDICYWNTNCIYRYVWLTYRQSRWNFACVWARWCPSTRTEHTLVSSVTCFSNTRSHGAVKVTFGPDWQTVCLNTHTSDWNLFVLSHIHTAQIQFRVDLRVTCVCVNTVYVLYVCHTHTLLNRIFCSCKAVVPYREPTRPQWPASGQILVMKANKHTHVHCTQTHTNTNIQIFVQLWNSM